MGVNTPSGTVGLARALSKLGHCSRAEGERLIRAGRVRVAGQVVTDPQRRVHPETAAEIGRASCRERVSLTV